MGWTTYCMVVLTIIALAVLMYLIERPIPVPMSVKWMYVTINSIFLMFCRQYRRKDLKAFLQHSGNFRPAITLMEAHRKEKYFRRMGRVTPIQHCICHMNMYISLICISNWACNIDLRYKYLCHWFRDGKVLDPLTWYFLLVYVTYF